MIKAQKSLGRPDIQLAGLEIWIHSRQFPDATDYWDGNWVHATAHCEAMGGSIWVRDNILHLPEIAQIIAGVESLGKELTGKVRLPCMEPELAFTLEAKSLGPIEMTVDITPDHFSQSHKFIFEINPSFFPRLLSDCRETLRKYPIKGTP